MKKIPSLFKRDYDGNRQLYDEVVPGCEWVIEGEGVGTVKYDGTACMVRDGVLYKRYDRKRKRGKVKAAPAGWEPCEPEPNEHTGHWPGWVPVGDGPEDKWHLEAVVMPDGLPVEDGTYELVGPKVQGNPYGLDRHELWRHGQYNASNNGLWSYSEWKIIAPRDFEGLRDCLARFPWEGIVWHHPDGRMCKIKRRDFGLPWPVQAGR